MDFGLNIFLIYTTHSVNWLWVSVIYTIPTVTCTILYCIVLLTESGTIVVVVADAVLVRMRQIDSVKLLNRFEPLMATASKQH